MKTSYLLILLIGFGMLSGCKDESKKSIETPEITFTKEGELTFIKAQGDTLVRFDIEVAKTSYEQQTGLMYRKSIEKNQGMLFVYPQERPRNGFYMKNTHIALDLMYINAENKLVDFNENTEPFNETPFPSKVPAKYVLEVSAGTVQNLGLELGDFVAFEVY